MEFAPTCLKIDGSAIHSEANRYLDKVESLVSQTNDVKRPVPDYMMVPFYRDTDVDRDHFITLEEAKLYYEDLVLVFEDSLGIAKMESMTAKLEKEDIEPATEDDSTL
ncbi:hypothetical protein ACFL6U_01805 [Planctomycetota bacterium]